MALIKSTKYAPDIYSSLNGILHIYKPPRLGSKELLTLLRERISDELNKYQPRPISKRVVIQGNIDEEKRIVEVPNLADHPLVVGPRYTPWELQMSAVSPYLGLRSSGLYMILIGTANRYFARAMNFANLVSVYHISGRFGYITDNFFNDGRIHDKSTFKHIRTGRMDSVLTRILSTQHERLFDSASVPLDSQEAYELAKAWPSRPPQSAKWPVIYSLKCIHLDLPVFKIEITVANENELFLAQLVHEIGLMLKSGAYTDSIRRVKLGPFSVDDSLVDTDWDLQSIVNNLSIYKNRYEELQELLRAHRKVMSVRTTYERRKNELIQGT